MLAGEPPPRPSLSQPLGDRPVVAHDAKALRTVPRNLEHDTEVAAYLLDPARRGYPLEELAQDHGSAADVDDPAAPTRLLIARPRRLQRERLGERGLERLLTRSSCRSCTCCARWRLGRQARLRAARGSPSACQREVLELEREIYELAGEEFTSARPSSSPRCCSCKLGLSRKRRGKTGYSTDARVLQAIRDEHEIIPKIER